MVARANSIRHLYAQVWLLIFSVIVFSVFVGFDRNYIHDMFAADSSKISILIVVVFLGACVHAAWHIFQTSSRLEAVQVILKRQGTQALEQTSEPHAVFASPTEYAEGFFSLMVKSKKLRPNEISTVLEVYADRARSATEIGWYIVDILIRMGLVGTIVGFILILGTLSDGPEPTADNIQSLLISMSGGMGIALYTTLAGLLTATFASLQYMVLGRCVERLISVLMALDEEALSWSDKS